MCGIAGASWSELFTSGVVNPEKLAEVQDSMAHRGPDDSGIFLDESNRAALVHTRLSIIDTSYLAHQPMIAGDEKVVIVFNGEIYNFQELREKLKASGSIFRGEGDTEVVLNLYLQEGPKMFAQINGIFSLAIWDSRNKTLLIARDALGVKPLYYSEQIDKGIFAFASELKSLFCLDEIDKTLDYQSLRRYLGFLWCPGGGTPVKEVRKLDPGEAVEVYEGRIKRRWNWYRLPATSKTVKPSTEKEAVTHCIRFLRQAVERQMVADVPLGAFLSGGLDSSAVVALAREVDPDIRCFTIALNGAAKDGLVADLPYARLVANHLKVPLDVVSVNSQRMAADLERMVLQLDEPLADPAALNVLYISELARSQGIKVLLSGTGGDDIFSGYRRHRALLLEKWWSWLPSATRGYFTEVTQHLDQRRVLGRRLKKFFNGADLNGEERLINYFRWIDDKQIHSLLNDEVLSELSSEQTGWPMLEFINEISPQVSPLERMLCLEQRFFLSDHNLIYTDKMSMAAGVEVRVPFLDLDLVEFAASLPSHFKQRGHSGKWILKEAMRPYLPKEVIERPKTGFGVPLRHWMRFELRELLADLLSVDSVRKRAIFKPDAIQRLIADNDSGQTDASYVLLSLMCIEIWCRNFIDRGKGLNMQKG